MRKVFRLMMVLTLMVSVSTHAHAVALSMNRGLEGHPYYEGILKLNELLVKYSGGSLTIDASQAVTGVKAMDFLQMRKLDIALESTMALSNFVPEVGVLDLPYLFETREEAFRVLDGEVGATLAELAEAKGFKILAWWDNGFRNITSRKGPIEKPEDLKGLRIRVPESAVSMTTFEALGAVPTPLASTIALSTLQLKEIDAAENSNSNNILSGFIEECPYYSVTKHMYSAEPLVMSLDRFGELTVLEQAALTMAAREAGDYQRRLSAETDAANIRAIAETVALNFIDDLSAFQEACKPVYEAFSEEFGELITMIHDALGQ